MAAEKSALIVGVSGIVGRNLADLLIAYIDDAHASGDIRPLEILDRRAKSG